MEPTHAIKKPILTEKSNIALENGRYTFLVDRRATKDDIKRSIEHIYDVKVVGVTTQMRKGKNRRLRYGWVKEGTTKKATVRLAEGQTIELF